MWVSTSSRRPLRPTGFRTPSIPSTVKPRGITWMISRSEGMPTSRAESRTRRTSLTEISPSGLATAHTP